MNLPIDYEAYCPACDNDIVFATRPKISQMCRCTNCDTELEVVDLDPLTLDWIYEDDDEYDFDDDDVIDDDLDDDDEM